MLTHRCFRQMVEQGGAAAPGPGPGTSSDDEEPEVVGELNFEEALEVRDPRMPPWSTCLPSLTLT